MGAGASQLQLSRARVEAEDEFARDPREGHKHGGRHRGCVSPDVPPQIDDLQSTQIGKAIIDVFCGALTRSISY